MLQNQIERFEELKLHENNQIIIIDNASTYEPLLEYYNTLPYEIIRLSKNYGHYAIGKVYDEYQKTYHLNSTNYVYTDPDIIPIEDCPDTFLGYFSELLSKYSLDKVGFGLKIDDLPDHFKLKADVIKWESQWFDNPITSNIFRAKIDTTFGLRRANTSPGLTDKCIRTGYPYESRHLPWYLNYDNLSDEYTNYLNTITESSHWSKQLK